MQHVLKEETTTIHLSFTFLSALTKRTEILCSASRFLFLKDFISLCVKGALSALVTGAMGARRGHQNTLKAEPQTFVSLHVGAGNGIQVT